MSECKCCGKDATTKCTICKKVEYCGDECKHDDWTIHQNNCNVYNVPTKNTWVAMPYMFEDFATENDLKNCNQEALKEIYNQKYLLKSVDPNRTVTQREQIGIPIPPGVSEGKIVAGKTLGAGKKPDISKYGDTYAIWVKHNGFEVPTGKFAYVPSANDSVFVGSMLEDTLYKGNNDPTIKKLIQFRSKNPDKYVFWPGNLRDTSIHPMPFEFEEEGGSLEIILITYNDTGNIDTNVILYQQRMMVYFDKLENKMLKNVQRNLRGLFGVFARQLKIKDIKPKNHAALYAKSDQGMEVRFIFNTSTGKKELVDIEVSVQVGKFTKVDNEKDSTPPLPPRDAIESSFICNATDIDQVTGLVMAMEEHIAQLKLERNGLTGEGKRIADETISRLNNTLNEITDHQIALEDHLNANNDDDFEFSTSINAELSRATDALWERNQNIGIRWKTAVDKSYYKLHKDDTYRKLKAEVDNLGVPEAGEDFKSKLKQWAMGKKGKAFGRLRAIEKILSERSREIITSRNLSFKEQQTDEELIAYEELNERVTQTIATSKK